VRAMAVTPAAAPAGTTTSDGVPQVSAVLGSGGSPSGSPATAIEEIDSGVQPATATPVQMLTSNRQLPSAAPSRSHAGSPSVQTTPFTPSVASTPPNATRQSLSARPPPRTKAWST